MIIFILIVTTAGFVIKTVERDIPAIEDIDRIFLSTSGSVYVPNVEEPGYYMNLYMVDREQVEKYNLPTYDSKGSMQMILDIHQTILDEEEINRYFTFNVSYFLKDGSVIRRYYEISPNYYDSDRGYDIQPQLIELANSEENKEVIYAFVYDEVHRSIYKDLEISYYNQEKEKSYELNLSKREVDLLTDALRKDIETYYDSNEVDYYTVGFSGNGDGFHKSIEVEMGNPRDVELYLQFLNNDYRVADYNIPYFFVNTREYLKELEQSN